MILSSRLHLNSSLTCLVPYDWTVTDAKQCRGRTVTDTKQRRGRMQGRLYITGSTQQDNWTPTYAIQSHNDIHSHQVVMVSGY